jgi:hypothetical protein
LLKFQAGSEQAVEQTSIYGMSLSPVATRETKFVEWGALIPANLKVIWTAETAMSREYFLDPELRT